MFFKKLYEFLIFHIVNFWMRVFVFILASLKDFWKHFLVIPLLLEVYLTLFFFTEHAAYNRIT